jgi:HEAT repeat protein
LREEALLSPYGSVQDAALEFCADMTEERFLAVLPAVAALADAAPPPRAIAAIRTMRGFAQSPQVVEALLRYRDAEEPDVRRAVAEALGASRLAPARAALMEMIQFDPEPRVRAAAVPALLAHATDEHRAEIAGVVIFRLEREIHAGVRERLIEAAGALRDSRAVGPLTGILRDPEGTDQARWAAISALARIGDAAAAPVIADFLDPHHSEDASARGSRRRRSA